MDPGIVTNDLTNRGQPVIPRSTGIGWRLAPMLDLRGVDAYLRLFGAKALPVGVNQGRLSAMGLPADVTEHALRQVRSVRDWDLGWTWAAQRFLGEGRVHLRAGRNEAAALSQQHAALAYHLAGILVFDDPRKIRALRAAASSLFARSVPGVRPAVRRVESSWRVSKLPGYLVLPEHASEPSPLVVILNGASTSKEETILWSELFLEHNLAVLALDWPGSGESSLSVLPTSDCDDFLDGVVSLATAEPGVDAGRIGLIGFSLGAAVATLAAARDRRVGAVVAVTPPYDSRRWLSRAQPLLRRHLATVAGGEDQVAQFAEEFALPGVVERSRCPMLVIGAGRDLIVPPEEAIRFCVAAGERGTLLWYPNGRHGLYEVLADWTSEAARWLKSALMVTTVSTRVDEAFESSGADDWTDRLPVTSA